MFYFLPSCVVQVVLQHSAVGDCAVVGLDDSLKGVVPLALCVLKNGRSRRVVCKIGNSRHRPHFLQLCTFQVCRKQRMKLRRRWWRWWGKTSGQWRPSGRSSSCEDCRRHALGRSPAPHCPTWSMENPIRSGTAFLHQLPPVFYCLWPWFEKHLLYCLLIPWFVSTWLNFHW